MEILGGPLFSVAGAGESHGPAITTIINGCPPGLRIEREEVQAYLDRRRPGGNKHGTPRNEKDKVVFLSGLYDARDHERLLAGPEISVAVEQNTFATQSYESGLTTGEPIAAVVLSTSKKSRDYTQLVGTEGEVRPGHTDLVKFYQSQQFVDVRGGGRSSYRSTISDVIGGAIARKFLFEHFGTVILSSISSVGPRNAKLTLAAHVEKILAAGQSNRVDADTLRMIAQGLESNEIHTIDQAFARDAAELIMRTRQDGDSLGAAVEVVAVNVPPLVGEPLYQSLKVRLMGALGGLNAVQSCEIGAGKAVVSRRGSENNDPIRSQGYQSNSHGGLLGGITTGMPLVCRVGFKPTSTIHKPQKSIRKDYQEIDFQLDKGRHDPCVGVRAGVTLESRLAIELANAVLVHQAQHISPAAFQLF
ncbi:chorismate synthase [Roseimaritima sediminicola]|uniref:chorismate synthase n=1 Tax=Roseimaritima sediminicola TaxID=2662066 RepID=UPI00129854D8|nr:chorismate synthase [Roseimaritima sediminicola]